MTTRCPGCGAPPSFPHHPACDVRSPEQPVASAMGEGVASEPRTAARLTKGSSAVPAAPSSIDDARERIVTDHHGNHWAILDDGEFPSPAPRRPDLRDPATVASVEADVETKLRDHQEADGAYACDPHTIVGYVLDALEALDA